MLKRLFLSEAISIAKNNFVHDGFKKLHSEQEKYERALANYEREISEIRERALLFSKENGVIKRKSFKPNII